MKITIEIGGNDYTFEMNRMAYKRLLADTEYAKMQNEISKRVKANNYKGKSSKEIEEEIVDEFTDEGLSEMLLRNMVMEEQIFYYSLLSNQPEMTKEKACALIDTAYAEYGREEVSNLTRTLIENFTQSGEETKKKMVMRMS